MKTALILVDLQNDFLPGGSLAVPFGNEVIAVANMLIPHAEVVVATQDWHPADHGSFASQHGKNVGERIQLGGQDQVLWPDHCIQNSEGADFSADIQLPEDLHVVRKGTNPMVDSYSGFFDNGQQLATEMHELLISLNVSRLLVMGLATDYCVKFTVLDALKLGYETTLISDGCRGVDLNVGDVRFAIEQMKQSGATLRTSKQLVNEKENEHENESSKTKEDQ